MPPFHAKVEVGAWYSGLLSHPLPLPCQPHTEAADDADRERRQKEEEERLAKLNDRVQELRTAHEQSTASLTLKERELEGTRIYFPRLAKRVKSRSVPHLCSIIYFPLAARRDLKREHEERALAEEEALRRLQLLEDAKKQAALESEVRGGRYLLRA